jgi:uncharacterized cupin superfamily protein
MGAAAEGFQGHAADATSARRGCSRNRLRTIAPCLKPGPPARIGPTCRFGELPLTDTPKPTREPVISLDALTLQPRPDAWLPQGAAADKFHVERAHLGDRMGLAKLGVNLTQVNPGRSGYPFHSHRANDELFYVIAGEGTLRLGERRLPVKAGDLIGCPVGGPDSAHQLVNTGSVPLRYLSISTNIDPEICEYPDSGKVGAYAGDDPKTGLMHLSRHADAKDYWDGE